MSLHISACRGCGAHYFPQRLRCHRCGGGDFEAQPISEASVTGVVTVHRFPQDWAWRCLVELRTACGVTLIAGAAQAPLVGARVGISQREDGAIVVSPLLKKEAP